MTTVALTAPGPSDRYKWIALSNTTLAVLMAMINQSILLISLPDIFRGIKLQPLAPGNTSYFLWILMGFILVTAVLVVSLGRVGDMYGRVRMYNLGFAIFTLFSILLSVTWLTGVSGALWIILMRIGQGVGGAFLFANSSAILTDAFPEHERGKAMGYNGVALVSGAFIGLIIGGVLAPIEWRLVFLVSVPFGLFGTVWAYLKFRDNGVRVKTQVDWLGNATFGLGLIGVLTGVIYGIQPYGGHSMGWTSPFVLGCVFGGLALLVAFVVIEQRVPNPMFQLRLFRIRAYLCGVGAGALVIMGRGSIQFILIIWLQGIWLPQHGYDFSQTPLWAGVYLIPLTVGYMASGPIAGILSDRIGPRILATVGATGQGIAFILLALTPMNFSYPLFALTLLFFSVMGGIFMSPNQAAVMNSLPPDQRGAGGGMNMTAQNSTQVLSIGLVFTIVTLGLVASLPSHLFSGLVAEGVPRAAAHKIAALPPIGSLFAAFLGFNPIKTLAPAHVLAGLGASKAAYLTGRSFFPRLIAPAFETGLRIAFYVSMAISFVAALISWVRGSTYIHSASRTGEEVAVGLLGSGEVASAEVGAGLLDESALEGAALTVESAPRNGATATSARRSI